MYILHHPYLPGFSFTYSYPLIVWSKILFPSGLVWYPWRNCLSGFVWVNLSSSPSNLLFILGSSKSRQIPGCKSSTSSLIESLIPQIHTVLSLIALIFCVTCSSIYGTTHLMQFLSMWNTRSFLWLIFNSRARSLKITSFNNVIYCMPF